ncbi:MAG: PAS domain-containing sensor histidine kinase, partial [Acidobacteria bacterium]|nr:PAS domain-containing sensor histidine kinase [Acidobacteriota bacterium]
GKAAPTVYEFKGKRKDGEMIDLEASVSISNVGGRAYITTAVRDIAERKRAEEELRRAYDELERRVEERTAELARANATLKEENAERLRAEESRKELLRRLVTAQEEDRRRISRELHDQMGQQLAALMMGLKRLETDSHGRQSTLNTLRQLQALTDQLSREVHTLAWGLRPPALDDLGLHTAIYNYVEEWAERSRVPVDFHSAGFGEGRLPFSHETALYRIAQEALTNVFKHSGADRVSFILERRGDHVLAVVEDNGKGFDVEALLGPSARGRRLGLLGMRERATLLGGSLIIESSPGAGTSVFVRIPLGAGGEEGEAQHG